MARKSRPRRRRLGVPKALRKFYGDRVENLQATILSLPPSPPPASSDDCRCRGQGCLGCRGSTHLLRKDDPPYYRRMLLCGFCAVDEKAPPPPKIYHDPPEERYELRTLVRKTMESKLVQLPDNVLHDANLWKKNLIFNGYNMRNHDLSPSGEFLCTGAWDLLLSRVGSLLVIYLLNFSSIFLPMLRKCHYQVTGRPFECSQPESSAFSRNKQHLRFQTKVNQVHMDNRLKRSDNVDERNASQSTFIPRLKRLLKDSESQDASYESITCNKRLKSLVECKKIDSLRILSFNEGDNNSGGLYLKDKICMSNLKKSISGMDKLQVAPFPTPVCNRKLLTDTLLPTDSEVIHVGNDISLCSSNQFDVHVACSDDRSSKCNFKKKSRKRGRLFIWQRRKKRKMAKALQDELTKDVNETYSSVFCLDSIVNLDNEPSHITRSSSFGMPTNLNLPNEKNRNSHSCTSKASSDVGSHTSFPEKRNRQQVNLSVGKYHIPGSLTANFEKNPSLCFYCIVLQASRKTSLEAQIKRGSIFHNRSLSAHVLPKIHILNRLKPNDAGAARLMKHIFGFPSECINFKPCGDSYSCNSINSQCLYHTFLNLLKALIRNAHRCQYWKLLLRHGSFQASERGHKKNALDKLKVLEELALKASKETSSKHVSNNGSSRNSAQKHEKISENSARNLELLGCNFNYHQVSSFVWSVCRSIIPVPLLGSSTTWRLLMKNISRFIMLHKFENSSLKQCIHGLKISRYPFFSKLNSFECFCKDEITFQSANNKSIRKKVGASNGMGILRVENIFHSWIYWLFSHLVVPIIRSNFYVTEMQSKKNKLYYYPKLVWNELVEGSTESSNSCNFQLMKLDSVKCILNKRSFGFSQVRFMPKQNGIRPIAICTRPSEVRFCNYESAERIKRSSVVAVGKTGKFRKQRKSKKKGEITRYKSVNSALKDLHVILRGITAESEELLGSSVFDYNDIHKELLQFLSRLRSTSSVMPKIFVVTADVSRAFDSINQDLLISILKSIIHNDTYTLKKCKRIICWKNISKVFYEYAYHSYSYKDGHAPLSSSRGLFIDQGATKIFRKQDLHNLLYEHVKHNILQFGHKFYLQKVGISQGSLLSCLLCSLYFGHLERSLLLPYLERVSKDINKPSVERLQLSSGDSASTSVAIISHVTEPSKHNMVSQVDKTSTHVTQCNHSSPIYFDTLSVCSNDSYFTSIGKQCLGPPDSLLLRFTDDFIFISTSKDQAVNFFKRMKRGFHDYNCYINTEKCGTNFSLDDNTYTGGDTSTFIPWCGLLINSNTMEIQGDYSRYSGLDMCCAVTIQAHVNPAYYLRVKLYELVRVKCHPIFYDSRLNSPAVVRLNAYQAFLLCAMKFHCLVRVVKGITKLKPVHITEIIENSIRHMYYLIKRLVTDMVKYLDIYPKIKLKKREFIWLGLSAYIRVLRKKQSRHKELLSALRSRISRYNSTARDSPDLKYAVDDSHSSVFWSIKF